MQVAQKVVQVLEDKLLPFTPEKVRKIAEEEGLGGDLDAIAQEVLEEGHRRMMAALHGLWETLGIPPALEVEEALRRKRSMFAHYFRGRG